MMRRFWTNGRLAWPPVLAFCVSALAFIAGDYAWRVSSISGKPIAVCALVVFLGSVGAAILVGNRQGTSERR